MKVSVGPTPEIWAKLAEQDEPILVRVKTIGQVGNGKSTFCNDFAEIYDKFGKLVEVFKTSGGVQSVNSGGKTAQVNPSVLPPNVTMYIQDGDGFGGLGKKVEDVTEENLRDIKQNPAVLVIVASATRCPTALISQLQILQIVSDINERNCFLLLTHAGRNGNRRLREPARQAAEYDPQQFLARLDAHGVNFFEIGRNVACVDLDPLDDLRYDTIERVRAAVCDLRPLIVRQTFKELLFTAEGDLAYLEGDRLEIKKLKKSLSNFESQAKEAAGRLAKYKSLIHEAVKKEDLSTTTGEYSHLEQDGKESGDVEGVDGQDDAAPASKRSRTSDSSSRRLSDSEFLMGIKEVFQSVATADSKPVLTAALEWVQDAYNDNEEYQIDVATRLTEDQALRVMAVSESKRKRILEIFIQ
ncbi:hypothetical protein H9P43_008744 [Blastocladiella emersonii ATCC 22665]|nr:hypothetical protein H9P43_008744 [Blastocladiella emersonii ATCC 22665]